EDGDPGAAPGASGAGGASRRSVKVTTYTSGNVPGVSYRGGYAHSPPEHDDELHDTGIQQPVAAQADPPGGTRVMPADSASQRERSAYDRSDDRRSPREDRPPRRERPAKRRRGFGFRLLRALLIFALIIVVALARKSVV